MIRKERFLLDSGKDSGGNSDYDWSFIFGPETRQETDKLSHLLVGISRIQELEKTFRFVNSQCKQVL